LEVAATTRGSHKRGLALEEGGVWRGTRNRMRKRVPVVVEQNLTQNNPHPFHLVVAAEVAMTMTAVK